MKQPGHKCVVRMPVHLSDFGLDFFRSWLVERRILILLGRCRFLASLAMWMSQRDLHWGIAVHEYGYLGVIVLAMTKDVNI